MSEIAAKGRLLLGPSERRDDRRAAPSGLLAAVVVGLIVAWAAVVVAEKLKPNRLLLLAALAPFVVATIRLGILRQAVLFGWIFSLTYSRNYYVYSRPGEWQGLYWIPSDLPFVALLGITLVEGFLRRGSARRKFSLLWLAIVPWIAVDLISLTTAERPDWVQWDLVKLARGAVVLLVVPATLAPRDWWTAVWAMGFAAAFQSIVGGFQVVLRRKAFVLEGETMVRAAGTMMHPNLLAAFLLLTVPIFAALAVGSQNRRVRLAAAATTLTGTAGLAATMSRFPIVLFAAIMFCLVLALLARKLIDVKRAIAWTALAAIATTAIALPFSGRIAERVAKNWKESVDFRANANAAAYRLFRENQLFGVGPTHYTTYMIKDNIAYRKLYKENVEDAKLTNVRYMLAVHNMYLLVLAETGLLGFAAFCCLIAVSLALGVRAVAFTDGDWRLASLGMTLGMAGMYGQGLTEYAMAMEQNFYPLLLTTALVGRAPALARAASVETSR